MTAVNIRLSEQLNNQLSSIAKTLSLPKSYLIREAIKNYINELEEDTKDLTIAEKVLASSTGKTLSFEEIEKKYGLEY